MCQRGCGVYQRFFLLCVSNLFGWFLLIPNKTSSPTLWGLLIAFSEDFGSDLRHFLKCFQNTSFVFWLTKKSHKWIYVETKPSFCAPYFSLGASCCSISFVKPMALFLAPSMERMFYIFRRPCTVERTNALLLTESMMDVTLSVRKKEFKYWTKWKCSHGKQIKRLTFRSGVNV